MADAHCAPIQILGAAVFLFTLYFVVQKAVKDAMDETGCPKS